MTSLWHWIPATTEFGADEEARRKFRLVTNQPSPLPARDAEKQKKIQDSEQSQHNNRF